MSFLQQVLVSALALTGSPIATRHGHRHGHEHEHGIDPLVDSQILTDPYAYDFPRLGAPGASLFPMRHCHRFKLEEASIDELQAQLSIGALTSVQLLECYVDRIYQTQPYLK